jgi:hypothetical protein
MGALASSCPKLLRLRLGGVRKHIDDRQAPGWLRALCGLTQLEVGRASGALAHPWRLALRRAAASRA